MKVRLFFLFLFSFFKLNAQFIGSTEITQILNNIQLAQQSVVGLDILLQEIENVKNISNQITSAMNDIESAVESVERGVGDIVSTPRRIIENLDNMIEQQKRFSERFTDNIEKAINGEQDIFDTVRGVDNAVNIYYYDSRKNRDQWYYNFNINRRLASDLSNVFEKIDSAGNKTDSLLGQQQLRLKAMTEKGKGDLRFQDDLLGFQQKQEERNFIKDIEKENEKRKIDTVDNVMRSGFYSLNVELAPSYQ